MKACLPIAFAFLLPLQTQGQAPLRFIGTSGVSDRIGREYVEYWNNRVAIEQQTQEFVQYGTTQDRVIPIVFHLVLPASVQIDATQINCQIASLNEDFNGQTFLEESAADLVVSFYDSITLAGRLDMFSRATENMGISFCLTQADAQGNPTTGVEFISAPGAGAIWTWDDAVKRDESGGLPVWDAEKFLNIWVCALADSVSGYAQMPGGPAETDGIVIDYRFFGCGGTAQAPYHKGKTLTHLVGNYLNLYDLWSYTFRCQDDNVDDTPVHNAPNTGGDHYRHISTCDGFPMEMTMNFMDNMDDSCMYMFTKGQMKRMQAVLAENGWRASLSQGQTCTTAPLTNGMLQSATRGQSDSNKSVEESLAFSVVPNPASTSLTVSISAPTEQMGILQITTTAGAMLYEARHVFAKGVNTILLDCSGWPRGAYLVTLTADNKPLSQLLIID